MSRLKDKVVVITGGGTGIGFAIAEKFVHEGAFVFITGRRQVELDKAVSRLGSNAEALAGDLTVSSDIDRLYEAVAAKKGRLDILIANSGSADSSHLPDINEGHFDGIFDLNVRGTLFSVQKALPLMKEGSAIVLVGSVAGVIGTPGYTAYNASKAAVRSFARTWTNELAKKGIRINTLSPGPVDTPMMQAASEDIRSSVISRIPLGRMAKPEEVADAALFLASNESSYIAGIELFIDGGFAQV
jgi:NAD(P)-dependent dehydrogenase (short-subunit alcohol dehydrogenase family)